MRKNCNVFYIPAKNRLVLQGSHENCRANTMGDPTCRLSSLSSPATVGNFVLMIADETVKPWPMSSDEEFKEITASTVKLTGFSNWTQLSRGARMCSVLVNENEVIVEKWVCAKDGRGFNSSKDPDDTVTCSADPAELGEVILRILQVEVPKEL